jgi:hypothetical protein
MDLPSNDENGSDALHQYKREFTSSGNQLLCVDPA